MRWLLILAWSLEVQGWVLRTGDSNLKRMKKVTGRLDEVTAEGFEVQVTQGQKVDSVRLRFADVTSVAEKLQHRKTSPWVWVLAGVGGAVLVLVIVGAVIATHGPI
jgi:hypothetical protein